MCDNDPVRRNIIHRQDRILCEGGLAEQRGFTLAWLEAETGIPQSTLKIYRKVESREPSIMSLATFVKLARVLPADLSSLLIESSGYGLSPKSEREKNWLVFAEKTAEFAAKVCRYQATGPDIDHREDADLTEDARRLAAEAHGMTIIEESETHRAGVGG